MPPKKSSVPVPSKPSVVVAAKLTPPAFQENQVARTELLSLIARNSGTKLVLVHSAAGFGKTTLMTQVLRRFQAEGINTAWLTLDSSDNDSSRFLAGLNAALTLTSPETKTDEEFNVVVERLKHRGAKFALFLDDFESIHDSSVLTIVKSFIESLPQGGQIFIGSRGLPNLPISRLRARGQMLELDTDLLRFSLDEANELFNKQFGNTTGKNLVRRIHQDTEGWVTALWLASRAQPNADEQESYLTEKFSGSSREIADYFAEAVFNQQSDEIKDFLLRCSILRHLETPLCQALMPRCDAALILEQLENQNLFLVALPGPTPSWRFHRLFSQFLQTRLIRERQSDIERLHLLASAWYESVNRPVPAVDHAIEAGDFPVALDLLKPHSQRLLEDGRMRLLAHWFSQMPDSVMAEHPLLQAVAIWSTLFTSGPVQASEQLGKSNCLTSESDEVQAHINALRPLLLTMRDQYDEAIALGDQCLAKLPTCNLYADGVLRNAMAHAFTVVGEITRAKKLIDEARQHSGYTNFNRMYAESIDGMIDFQAGRLRMATSHFRDSLNSTRAQSNNFSSGNAWAGILYAGVLYEANELDKAEHLVDLHLPTACATGLPGHIGAGYLIRARIAYSKGEISRSFEALTEMEYMAHHRQLPRIVANAKLERSRLLLLQGDAQVSKEELDRVESDALQERLSRQRLAANEVYYPALAKVCWTLHFGEPQSVLKWFEQEIETTIQQNRHRRALRLQVLHSLALQRSGNPKEAAKVMSNALRLAAQEGFVRSIADEGPEVGRIIQRLHSLQLEMPANRSDPVRLQYLEKLLKAFGALPQEPNQPAQKNGLVEALTRKEIQILQLVAEGYSNARLAEKMSASDSTIRTHLRNINSKLGASSRAEAVVIGRQFGVIR
jgi:LuxR family maltose regulon positive regulatory protein